MIIGGMATNLQIAANHHIGPGKNGIKNGKNGIKKPFGVATNNNNNTIDEVEKTAHVDPRNYDDLVRLAKVVSAMADLKEHPTIGIICGSGLGELADLLTNPRILPFKEVPGFPKTNVIGHKGNLVFGHIGGKYVICLQGRFHPYEHNMDLVLCSMPVRLMHLLGVSTLIVSNAAGGVNENFKYGDLMLIKDHIFMPGLTGFSPMVGLNDPRFGPRFVSMHHAYDKNLREQAKVLANELEIRLHEGVYVMSGGPQYETPAESLMYKTMGVDALGMSTCHEVTVAIQCQMKVFGFSLITNLVNTDGDSSVEVSHEEVLEAARMSSKNACKLVLALVKGL